MVEPWNYGFGNWAIFRELPDWDDIMIAAAPGMIEFGEIAQRAAQVRCPVDEGRLIQTIRLEEMGLHLVLVAGGLVIRGKYVHYAAIVHDGLGRGRNAIPRPFLAQGINAALRVLERQQYGTPSYGPTPVLVPDPYGAVGSYFASNMVTKSSIVQAYAVPSHIGFGTTPIGRVPKGQPGAGRFFSLKDYLD